jgi:hypothetical protein
MSSESDENNAFLVDNNFSTNKSDFIFEKIKINTSSLNNQANENNTPIRVIKNKNSIRRNSTNNLTNIAEMLSAKNCLNSIIFAFLVIIFMGFTGR